MSTFYQFLIYIFHNICPPVSKFIMLFTEHIKYDISGKKFEKIRLETAIYVNSILMSFSIFLHVFLHLPLYLQNNKRENFKICLLYTHIPQCSISTVSNSTDFTDLHIVYAKFYKIIFFYQFRYFAFDTQRRTSGGVIFLV